MVCPDKRIQMTYWVYFDDFDMYLYAGLGLIN